VAKVSDQFGNGVPGVVVTWEASDGSLSASEVPTDPAGTSSVIVTLPGTVGPITITAAADVPTGSPQTYTAEATEVSTSAEVSVVNNAFNPSTITIAPGTTVTWTWAPTAVLHNVAPVAGGTEPARSGNPTNAPFTHEHTFNNPGTYNYTCEVHGPAMSGVVTVQ
jgi:plastocyanin